MGARRCIGGIDVADHGSLRLLHAGLVSQPADTPLQIGALWEVTYQRRNSPAPFVEDVDATLQQQLGAQDVLSYVSAHMDIVTGDTSILYQGKLRWNPHKGFIEPADPSAFSTQFWRPASFLRRYDDGNRAGKSIFWEPETKRRIPWVGEAGPPEQIEANQLVRVSLGRPFKGSEDHAVDWLQLSGVY